MNDKISTEKLAKRLLGCNILFKWQETQMEYNEVHVLEVVDNVIKVQYIGQVRYSWLDVGKLGEIKVIREKNI